MVAASCRQVYWKADGQNQTDWNFGVGDWVTHLGGMGRRAAEAELVQSVVQPSLE